MKWNECSKHTQDLLCLAAYHAAVSGARAAYRLLRHFGGKRIDLVAVYEGAGNYFFDLAKKIEEKS